MSVLRREVPSLKIMRGISGNKGCQSIEMLKLVRMMIRELYDYENEVENITDRFSDELSSKEHVIWKKQVRKTSRDAQKIMKRLKASAKMAEARIVQKTQEAAVDIGNYEATDSDDDISVAESTFQELCGNCCSESRVGLSQS